MRPDARYPTVYIDLRQRIEVGEFAVVDRLPSISSLQEHYGVGSPSTIRRAEQMLVEDGLIHVRRGVGATVGRDNSAQRAVDVVPELQDVTSDLRAARRAIQRAILALSLVDDAADESQPPASDQGRVSTVG